jgi:hypothetical protein
MCSQLAERLPNLLGFSFFFKPARSGIGRTGAEKEEEERETKQIAGKGKIVRGAEQVG